MGFHLIKGTFHVKGYAPDGDSVKFRADDLANWNLLGPGPLNINSKKHVQLRLEAIDTLETHFPAPGGEVSQPLHLANAATDFFLHELNITGVQWNADHRRIIEANDGTPGFILSREKERNGRPVSFVFAGTTDHADGSEVFLTVDMMKESINYKSIAAGQAFPTYYEGLFADLRDALSGAAKAARAQWLGVYQADRTNTGVRVDSLNAITEEHIVLPKLFRRLAEFIAGDPTPDMNLFLEWLEMKSERVLVLRNANFTHFDDLIEVDDLVMRLTELPEDMVFQG